MKTLLITLSLLFCFTFVQIEPIYAQVPPPPTFPEKPDQAPIDGGLALLAVAGGAYGLKKLNEKRKE